MRHLVGVILAPLLAAALFAGGGWGTQMIRSAQPGGTGLTSMHGLLALAAVAGTGLLLGLLLVGPAVSPLAAGLPGLALLAWTALWVVRSASALRLIPMHDRGVGQGFQVLLTSGVLALLGAAMIVPLFVPSRWRRRRQREVAYGEYNDGYDGYDGYGPTDATGLLR
jgi:hypothetical protein